MAGVGGFVIIDLERQVKFVVAKIVRLLAVAEPSQFQLVRAVPILQIDDDEAPILRLDPPHFVHVKGFGVEFQALFKVEHVEVVVNHPEFHCNTPYSVNTTSAEGNVPFFVNISNTKEAISGQPVSFRKTPDNGNNFLDHWLV